MLTLQELEELRAKAKEDAAAYDADDPISVAALRLHDAADILHALKFRSLVPQELLSALFAHRIEPEEVVKFSARPKKTKGSEQA